MTVTAFERLNARHPVDEFLLFATVRVIGKAPHGYGDATDFKLWRMKFDLVRDRLVQEDFPINV